MNTIKLKKYEQYNENEILALYNSVEWINYTNNPEMLRNAFNNSLTIVGAYEDERLIGIIRVVGDGHSIIYIQDIIVLPETWNTGFYPSDDLITIADRNGARTKALLSAFAKEHNVNIVGGSVAVAKDNLVFNTS